MGLSLSCDGTTDRLHTPSLSGWSVDAPRFLVSLNLPTAVIRTARYNDLAHMHYVPE